MPYSDGDLNRYNILIQEAEEFGEAWQLPPPCRVEEGVDGSGGGGADDGGGEGSTAGVKTAAIKCLFSTLYFMLVYRKHAPLPPPLPDSINKATIDTPATSPCAAEFVDSHRSIRTVVKSMSGVC